MKENKYRAFIKNQRKMLYGVQTTPIDMFTLNHAYHNNEVIVMQYTGIKDREGVEIYEGDVFNYRCGGTLQATPYVVESAFELWRDIGEGEGDSYYSMSGFEVIGNIYENPELAHNENERLMV